MSKQSWSVGRFACLPARRSACMLYSIPVQVCELLNSRFYAKYIFIIWTNLIDTKFQLFYLFNIEWKGNRRRCELKKKTKK